MTEAQKAQTTALRWLQTLIKSEHAVTWDPEQKQAAQQAHDEALSYVEAPKA